MKRLLSIVLSVLIIFSCFFEINAFAATKPYYFEKNQFGRAIVSTSVYFSKKKDLSFDETKQRGKVITISANNRIRILGKNYKSGKYLYIQKSYNGDIYYGYISVDKVAIDNSSNYMLYQTDKIYNPWDGNNHIYDYYLYHDMPFYQFYQIRPGSVNGLRISCSCGPHSLATILSALTEQVIHPEYIMKNMSRSSITSSAKGTYVSLVTQSVHQSIENKYKYNYVYSYIQPNEAFNYLKNGYYVILGVENTDGRGLFTAYSHYITLVGYDAVGNVMTVNTNKRTSLFESFSEARMKKYIVNSNFYRYNTVAIKYEFNDSYTEYKEPVKSQTSTKTRIYEHKNAGFFDTVKQNKKITILGEKDGSFYVEYKYNGQPKTGFISIEDTANGVEPSLSREEYYYTGKETTPKVTIKSKNGKELERNVDYKLERPEKSKKIGEYTIKIDYIGKYYGATKLKYRIVPKPTKINSVRAGKQKIKLSWKKSNDISGYQVQYSANKNFTSDKIVKVSKNKSSTILHTTFAKKRYYVHVRTYKIINGKTYYSKWSGWKSVRVR